MRWPKTATKQRARQSLITETGLESQEAPFLILVQLALACDLWARHVTFPNLTHEEWYYLPCFLPWQSTELIYIDVHFKLNTNWTRCYWLRLGWRGSIRCLRHKKLTAGSHEGKALWVISLSPHKDFSWWRHRELCSFLSTVKWNPKHKIFTFVIPQITKQFIFTTVKRAKTRKFRVSTV